VNGKEKERGCKKNPSHCRGKNKKEREGGEKIGEQRKEIKIQKKKKKRGN
jgi:hypothetical protein